MKDIHWMGSSYKALLEFPKNAKKEAGYQLDKIQRGLEPSDWKSMISIDHGVKEIRIHDENQYRVLYIAKFEDAIYILHAFCKKTQKTSKKDLEIAKNGLMQLKKMKKKK